MTAAANAHHGAQTTRHPIWLLLCGAAMAVAYLILAWLEHYVGVRGTDLGS